MDGLFFVPSCFGISDENEAVFDIASKIFRVKNVWLGLDWTELLLMRLFVYFGEKTDEYHTWFGDLVVFICVFIWCQYSCTWRSSPFCHILFFFKTFFPILGMFREVGKFVIDGSGEHKFLNNESILWTNNLPAPSSEMMNCKSCGENCYNGIVTY